MRSVEKARPERSAAPFRHGELSPAMGDVDMRVRTLGCSAGADGRRVGRLIGT